MITREAISPHRSDALAVGVLAVVLAFGALCLFVGMDVGEQHQEPHQGDEHARTCQHYDFYASIGDGVFYSPPRACERPDASVEYGVHVDVRKPSELQWNVSSLVQLTEAPVGFRDNDTLTIYTYRHVTLVGAHWECARKLVGSQWRSECHDTAGMP